MLKWLPPSPVCNTSTKTSSLSLFFFFNDTATTEIYTLSLHDALPIYLALLLAFHGGPPAVAGPVKVVTSLTTYAAIAREIVGDRGTVASIANGDENPHYVQDRKSTRLNSSHDQISYAVFCLKKKNNSKDHEGVRWRLPRASSHLHSRHALTPTDGLWNACRQRYRLHPHLHDARHICQPCRLCAPLSHAGLCDARTGFWWFSRIALGSSVESGSCVCRWGGLLSGKCARHASLRGPGQYCFFFF